MKTIGKQTNYAPKFELRFFRNPTHPKRFGRRLYTRAVYRYNCGLIMPKQSGDKTPTPKIQIAFSPDQARYLRQNAGNVSGLIKTLLAQHFADFPPSVGRGRQPKAK